MIHEEELRHWIRTIASIVVVLAIVGLLNITKACDRADRNNQGTQQPPSNSMWSKVHVTHPADPPRRELADVVVPAHGFATLEWHRPESVWWEVPQGVKMIREWEDPNTHQPTSKDPEQIDRQFAEPTPRGNSVLGRTTFYATNFSEPVHVVLYGDVPPGDTNWTLRASSAPSQ